MTMRLTNPTAMLRTSLISLTRDMTAATGDVAYTGAGFRPRSVIVLGVIAATLVITAGFTDNALVQAAHYGDNSGLRSWIANVATLEAAVGNSQQATLSSFDADGFTLAWLKVLFPTGTAKLHVLCVE